MKNLFEQWREFISETKATSREFTEVAYNTMLAKSVFADEGTLFEVEAGEYEYEFSLAENPQKEVVSRFRDSLYSSERAGFLSPYAYEELLMMDLYLLKGHNAGFAIKDGDDIVSVHNNSELRGLGSEFMRKAKEVGGARLDHFDGFLSGLYRKYGFTDVYEVYQWNEQYAPKEWDYDQIINIMDPRTSIYADALEELVYDDPNTLPNENVEIVAEDQFEITVNPSLKFNAYKNGRPDVILRKLG